MTELILLAQSYEDHMRAARFYETLGWVLGILAFVVLIGGVIYGELRQRKRKRENQDSEKK